MRVITRRATMLVGHRSRCAISPASTLSESRNHPNCVHWRIFYFMWLWRIYEFFCVDSNPIKKVRNYRDYRPSHLKFREYFWPFWFSRSCVVVAYCNRRMRSSNVQVFVIFVMFKLMFKKCSKKKIMFRCIVIGECAVQLFNINYNNYYSINYYNKLLNYYYVNY